MSVKTIVSGVACLALAGTLALSPIGVPGFMNARSQSAAVADRQASAEYRLNNAQANLIRVVEELNAARSFDVYYGDLDNIAKVFTAFGGIEVKSLCAVDHKNNFTDIGPITDGEEVSAVHYTLEVEDLINTLGLLEQMELPIYSIVITDNRVIDVIFMTGGAI